MSVVPEESERCDGRIGVAGSPAPGLSLTIAGSFHIVIRESKISARVGASRVSLLTPGRRKASAIGPPTVGRWTA